MRWRVLFALGGVLAAAAPLGAQEPPVQQPPPDTLQQAVDSTWIRLRERLDRLARPIDLDSLRRADSLAVLGDSARAAPLRRALPVAQGDSILAQLRALPGYEETRYEALAAQLVERDGKLVLELLGHRGAGLDSGVVARIASGEVDLQADSTISYDEELGRLIARGRPLSTSGNSNPVRSETIVALVDRERATAAGARTEYSTGGANWVVSGDLDTDEGRLYGHDISFTSCTLEIPHYHFLADDVKINPDQVLVAKGVTLYFADVPVFYLPFIAQSLKQGRRSGLLTPRFGINDVVSTSSGYERRISQVGFYWAMSDYMDSQLYFDWFSGEYLSATGSYRFRWTEKFLNGAVNYRHFFRDDGSSDLSFATNSRWEPDERTQMSLNARFASSNDLVRRTSFDPREVTRSINSDGRISRRFDWGQAGLTVSRRQFSSDDRVEATLPSLSVSFRPVSLFSAPAASASWYNNVTLNGGGDFARRTRSFDRAADEEFSLSRADTETRNANFNLSMNIGALSLGQRLSAEERVVRALPRGEGDDVEVSDVAETSGTVSFSGSYQVPLVGTSSLSPSVSLSREFLRSDTISDASGLVFGPDRISLGLQLRGDIYGFFGGFGRYEGIRHKISPSISWDYSPAVTPTEEQERVFGARASGVRSVLSFGLSQTWEAKPDPTALDEEGVPGPETEGVEPGVEPGGAQVAGEEAGAGATEARGQVVGGGLPAAGARRTAAGGAGDEGGPRSPQQAPKVRLLGIQTSGIRYDLEHADSTGDFLAGFLTRQVTNQITSDLIPGTTISMTHDLFEDDSETGERSFSPHLSGMNFGLSFGSGSWIARLLGLGGAGAPAPGGGVGAEEEFDPDLSDPSESIVPGTGEVGEREPRERTIGPVGQWRTSLQYALQRPRNGLAAQTISGSLQLTPTEHWEFRWSTSYDLSRGAFNDHSLELTRDLHRWQLILDFNQTATGSWSFDFRVSLIDNQDLKLDFQQRNAGDPSGRIR